MTNAGAGCHQGVSAKSRHSLPPLPFGPDERAKNQPERQANREVRPDHVLLVPPCPGGLGLSCSLAIFHLMVNMHRVQILVVENP